MFQYILMFLTFEFFACSTDLLSLGSRDASPKNKFPGDRPYAKGILFVAKFI